MKDCTEAVNLACKLPSRGKLRCKKLHCKDCGRHLCPVCKGHYKVMIFSEDPEGCSTQCVKVTHNDLEPWQPPAARTVDTDGMRPYQTPTADRVKDLG